MLPGHLAQMIGPLRGKDPPSEEILCRLYDINPNYRVTFTHSTLDRITPDGVVRGRPPLWWVHEVRPGNPHDEARRRAAGARLERWHSKGAAYQAAHPSTPAQCEDYIRGYHTVGQWPDTRVVEGVAPFWSEQMFVELIEGERAYRSAVARVTQSNNLDLAADEFAREEYEANERFRDAVRQAALEDWAIVCRGKHSIIDPGPLTMKEEAVDAGTDG